MIGVLLRLLEGEKKGLHLCKPFKYMVGRERFERSTSGLKDLLKTSKNALNRTTKALLFHFKMI